LALGAIPDRTVAFDFGCGVGRLTRGLASRFEPTVRIGIFPWTIALAERDNALPERCRFLASGGALVRQAAAEPAAGLTLPARLPLRPPYELGREANPRAAPVANFAMVGLPRAEGERLLVGRGPGIVAVGEDSAGLGWRNLTYVAIGPGWRQPVPTVRTPTAGRSGRWGSATPLARPR